MVLGIFIFLYSVSPGSTSAFKDKQERLLKRVWPKWNMFTIGGVEQFILIRGKNRDNPILLSYMEARTS